MVQDRQQPRPLAQRVACPRLHQCVEHAAVDVLIADVRSQRSSSDLNGPSLSRISTRLSTACWPTFLIAASPKRIFSSLMEKSARERLMSGASTSIPRARQSTIPVATLSAEPSMWISNEVMYSSG